MGSNALSLFNGLKRQNVAIKLIDTQFFDIPAVFSIRRVFKKILPNYYGYLASLILHIKVQFIAARFRPDLIFVFKGNFISKRTLKRFKVTKVHFHPDDSSNPSNRTVIFDLAESLYDIHFTPKRHNVDEIYVRTGKNALFIWYAYDKTWHRRELALDFENPNYEVGFIGHMRPDRINLIISIASFYGKSFAISGLRWNRVPNLVKMAVLLPPSYGENFSKFIAAAPIQLGLLNSENRDQHTARTFEVPAAGGLLLAEDTLEHREIFESERNALFFNSPEDLLLKISWVRRNPIIAKQIAENGYLHITTNANSWDDRAIEMLRLLTQNGF